MSFINELTTVFTQHANAENAKPMEAYMKGLFKYHGIKTDERRRLFKEVWNRHKDEVAVHPREIALELYCKSRGYCHHYTGEVYKVPFGQEAFKYKKKGFQAFARYS